MAEPLTLDGLRAAFAAEFRAALEAALGHGMTVSPPAVVPDSGWAVELAVSGAMQGRLAVWIDDAGVPAIGRALMNLDEAPDPNVAAEMLRGVVSQAASAVLQRDGFAAVRLVVGALASGPAPSDAAVTAIADGSGSPIVVAISGAVQTSAPAAGAPGPPATAPARYPGNLAALLDIDLPVVVRFARTELALRTLAQLGPGSVVDMGRSPDAPVQLLVGAQVIAEGEVVVVGGNYGVRITSLVSPADRLKAMEL